MRRSCYIVGGCLAIVGMVSACGRDADRGSDAPGSGGVAPGSGGSAGGEPGTGSTSATGGSAATGGTGGIAGSQPASSGGVSSGGTAGGEHAGSGGSGGADTGGASSTSANAECTEATDCQLLRTPCGCFSYPVGGETPSVPTDCELDWCTELEVTDEDVACLRGRCSLALECYQYIGTCEQPQPDCANEEVPAGRDGCYGPCVPVAECVPDYWTVRDYSILEGVWLIGWPGGELHYSVLRFPPSIADAVEGEVEFLADPNLPANVPFFPCSGVGAFSINSAIGSYSLFYPPGCGDGVNPDTSIQFEHFDAGYGEHGSTLHATVHVADVGTEPIDGWWFPADECDAAMTHCGFEESSTD